jgi:hypothetical protein
MRIPQALLKPQSMMAISALEAHAHSAALPLSALPTGSPFTASEQ